MSDPVADAVREGASATVSLHAELLVEDALRLHPRLAALLRERGVVCLRCGEPVWGTLGETIAGKGLPVDALLRELEAELGRNP